LLFNLKYWVAQFLLQTPQPALLAFGAGCKRVSRITHRAKKRFAASMLTI